MKASLTVLASLMVLACGSASAGTVPPGVPGSGFDFVPGGDNVACFTGVRFDGACRGESWIESNLSGGVEVEDFGKCDDTDACDLYFTVVDSQSTSGHISSHSMSTYMLKSDQCTTGAGCVGGYTASMKTSLEISFNAELNRAEVTFSMSLGRRMTLNPDRIVLQPIGTADLVAARSFQQVSVFDRQGDFLSGYSMYAGLADPDVLEATCEDFISGLVEIGADLAAGGVAAGVFAGLSYAATELAAAAFFVNPLLGLGTWVLGERASILAAGASAIAVRSYLKALAEHYDVNSICDDINPNDADISGDDVPTNEDESEPIGCTECTEWGYDEHEYTYYEDDGTLVVVSERGTEWGCLSWQIDPMGSDTDGDGWCD